MSLATASKIKRLFGGHFDEKGQFVHEGGAKPHRYRCSCNPNGFVSGQVINHYTFCPYNKQNLEALLGMESFKVQLAVAVLVITLCALASWGVINAIISFNLAI